MTYIGGRAYFYLIRIYAAYYYLPKPPTDDIIKYGRV